MGLLVIKRYELFDCRDYKAFHEIRHEEENIRTYVGIWINDRWQIIKRDGDDLYDLGTDDYEMQILRWAELPVTTEGDPNLEYFNDAAADEVVEKIKDVPVSIDGIKYIK